uniref:Uncharacterized protein n=1 Tax=Helicobacter pylori TaxID=210 RepID=Q7WSM8_HELPX|nr:unknown [Helicobacter pylori]
MKRSLGTKIIANLLTTAKINILDLKDSKMKQVLQDNSISPCLVDDYRYLNKGIPNFFDYNMRSNRQNQNIRQYPKVSNGYA